MGKKKQNNQHKATQQLSKKELASKRREEEQLLKEMIAENKNAVINNTNGTSVGNIEDNTELLDKTYDEINSAIEFIFHSFG